MFNPKPVLRCRRIRRGAAVIRIYRSGMIPSKIIFVVNCSWWPIKIAFVFVAFETVHEPSTIKIHSCVGGAIRTVNSTDVNVLKQFAISTPVTEYAMTCQNCACVVRKLQAVCGKLHVTLICVAWFERDCITPYPYTWPYWRWIRTVSVPIQSQVLTASHSKQKNVYWLNQKYRIFLILRLRC